ncbi:MAG: hypothetical protein Unbinned5374contig1001_24 [Prokaryotic dsDNA virus sp.]|nr:MAG: hypothetical protein Unbinned5374contig1001_24 [Prokaryotic dsDNA virus sp.]
MALKNNIYLVKLWKSGEMELVEEHKLSEEEFKIFFCPIGFRATYEDIKNEEST